MNRGDRYNVNGPMRSNPADFRRNQRPKHPDPPKRSPPPIPWTASNEKQSVNRDDGNNDDDADDEAEYEMVCSQSVICGVNAYPETKEFRDEDKMWRSQCEKNRKKQRSERMQSQLKVQDENVDDEFEKLFDEGMRRWDMVQHSGLDRRIWEWAINLNYNDAHSRYGFGTSNIRNSPYFKP